MASAASSTGVLGGTGGDVGAGAGAVVTPPTAPAAPGAPPRFPPPPPRPAVGTLRPKMAFFAINRSTIGFRWVRCCAVTEAPRTAAHTTPTVRRPFIRTPLMLRTILLVICYWLW